MQLTLDEIKSAANGCARIEQNELGFEFYGNNLTEILKNILKR